MCGARMPRLRVLRGPRRVAQRPLEKIADMSLRHPPRQPTWPELQQKARNFPPKDMHADWVDFLS